MSCTVRYPYAMHIIGNRHRYSHRKQRHCFDLSSPPSQCIAAQALAPSLRHLPALRSLCLSHEQYWIPNWTTEIKAIAPSLSLLTNLQHLNLTSCFFLGDHKADGELAACLACLTGLQHLAGVSLWGNDNEATLFAPVLVTLTALRHLEMDVKGGNIAKLADTLRCLTAMQHLALRGNGEDTDIEAAGEAALAVCMSRLTSMEHLEIRGLSLRNSGPAATLLPSLGSLTDLRRLNLGYNGMGLGGAAALATCISALTGLRYLNLEGNNLQNDGAMARPVWASSRACNTWNWGAMTLRMTAPQRWRCISGPSRAWNVCV